jgi:hypothetical protein
LKVLDAICSISAVTVEERSDSTVKLENIEDWFPRSLDESLKQSALSG